ncbi:MAG: glycosyltransferase family A protein, partial [Candidatus Dojkabacteria bacterium]|nr:glycosyltransferase family A protein [Candidatus Dojkabacteria bacterium]
MVTIIIPVYNAEKTLKKCLDSILHQTYTKYEVILINDGSKDKSLQIVQEYKEKHPDIFQIYDQENVGPAVTRNSGMQCAKGEYLFFIDCDDYIDEKYIETFVKEIEEKEVDMVIGGYRRVRSDGALIF